MTKLKKKHKVQKRGCQEKLQPSFVWRQQRVPDDIHLLYVTCPDREVIQSCNDASLDNTRSTLPYIHGSYFHSHVPFISYFKLALLTFVTLHYGVPIRSRCISSYATVQAKVTHKMRQLSLHLKQDIIDFCIGVMDHYYDLKSKFGALQCKVPKQHFWANILGFLTIQGDSREYAGTSVAHLVCKKKKKFV